MPHFKNPISEQDPFAYCAQKTQQAQSNFMRVLFGLSAEKKQALEVVYAFCRTLDDIVDQDLDQTVAAQKLNWWHFEIEKIFDLPAYPGQHPISQALKIILNTRPEYQLQKKYFLELIFGMSLDLTQSRYQNFSELKNYCYYAASTVGLLIISIFGYTDPNTQLYAKNLGIAFQLINIIRDVGEDFRRNRIYCPQTDLKQFNLTESDLHAKNNSENFKLFMAFQANRARAFYQLALEQLDPKDRNNQKPGLIMAAIYIELLNTIQANQFDVLHQKISLPTWRKIWIAIRTSWTEWFKICRQ